MSPSTARRICRAKLPRAWPRRVTSPGRTRGTSLSSGRGSTPRSGSRPEAPAVGARRPCSFRTRNSLRFGEMSTPGSEKSGKKESPTPPSWLRPGLKRLGIGSWPGVGFHPLGWAAWCPPWAKGAIALQCRPEDVARFDGRPRPAHAASGRPGAGASDGARRRMPHGARRLRGTRYALFLPRGGGPEDDAYWGGRL